jgi:hypothetical protein
VQPTPPAGTRGIYCKYVAQQDSPANGCELGWAWSRGARERSVRQPAKVVLMGTADLVGGGADRRNARGSDWRSTIVVWVMIRAMPSAPVGVAHEDFGLRSTGFVAADGLPP